MSSKSKKRRFSDEEDDSSSEESDNNVSSTGKSKRVKSNSGDALDISMVSADTTSSETSSKSSDSSESGDQNVRVVARLRPLSVKERTEQSEETIKALTKTCTIMVDKNRKYEYDAVLGPTTTQHQVYEQTAGDMVKSNIFKGFNVTILAYGQTGSGKTFTMGTSGGGGDNIAENEAGDEQQKITSKEESFLPPSEGDGIIPRAVYDLFKTREEMKSGKDRVTVKMSYLEIYNETCRDLLCEDPSSKVLHIRDSKTDGVYVQNLSSVEVKKPSEVSELMDSASTKRATASTHMNAVSSRSHAICTLDVTVAPLEDIDDDEEEDSSEIQIRSKLTLVDLAGSERIKRTGAEGSRMKEGININKGLFVLGQVVSSLSELGHQGNQASNSHLHIPYRDSKLTRLLQDSLGGNSRTILVACISPADSNVEESINTLRYASRARNIKNSAVQNVVANAMSPAEAAALRRENQMLKLQLVQMESKLNSQPTMAISTTMSNSGMATQSDTSSMTTSNVDVDISGLNVEKLEIVSKLRTKCVFLQSKISQLEDQNISAAEDALTASLKADKAQLKLEQVLATAKSQNITLFTDLDAEKETNTLAEKLRNEVAELKSKLQAAQSEAAVSRATAAAVVAGDGNLSTAEELALAGESDDSNGSSENNNEQLTAALMAVSDEIEQKEAMAIHVNKERECMEVMKSHFESAIQSLQSEVDVLSSERQNLLEKMTQKTGNTNENMRTRIKELENRIKELKNKAAEHSKSLRMREIAERKCAQLSAEIQADKKRRAALQRKLKEESEDRRSEKKAAQREATRMLRNSQRLKIELQKVKDEATRQAAVLRRKAAEALSRQKKQAEMQKKRNIAAAMRAQAKNSRKRPGSSSESDERRDALATWLEREIEASLTLHQTREHIEEQTTLLEEVLSKKEDTSDNMDIAAARAMDSEIDSRRAIIKQLERNAQDFQKAFDGPGGSIHAESKTFQDASTWNNLSRSEVKLVFLKAFETLVALKNEAAKLRSKQAEEVARAVNKAVAAERRSTEDRVVKLKLEHSEAMAALLESTKAAMEHEIRTNLLKQGNDDVKDISLQSVVDDMLKKYLDSCNQVSAKVKEELQDVKTHQDGLKQMMDLAANGIIAKNEVAAKKKKKKLKKSLSGDVEEAFFEEEEELEEDSDDSDWSPDTPAKKKQKIDKLPAKEKSRNESIESSASLSILSDQLAGERISLEPQEVKKDIPPLESLRVVELKEILKKYGLPVSGKKSELILRLQNHMQSSSESSQDVDQDEDQKFKSEQVDQVAVKGNGDKVEELSKNNSADTKVTKAALRTSSRRKSAVSPKDSQQKENKSQEATKATKTSHRTKSRSKSLLSQVGSQDKENETQFTEKICRSGLKRKPLEPAVSEDSERNKIVSFSKDEKIPTSTTVGTEPREKLTLSARKRRRRNMNLAVDKALQEVDKLKDIGDFVGRGRRS